MTIHSQAAHDSAILAAGGTRLAAGLAALVLGAFFIFGAGFAQSATLHDTAHDVRHTNVFPCH